MEHSHMKRRLFLTALCAVVLSTSPGLVGCSSSVQEPDGEFNDEGRIRELDVKNRILVIRHRYPTQNTNEEIRIFRTYKVAYDCRISTTHKPTASLSDLRDNDEINVRYIKDGTDFVLQRIKPD